MLSALHGYWHTLQVTDEMIAESRQQQDDGKMMKHLQQKRKIVDEALRYTGEYIGTLNILIQNNPPTPRVLTGAPWKAKYWSTWPMVPSTTTPSVSRGARSSSPMPNNRDYATPARRSDDTHSEGSTWESNRAGTASSGYSRSRSSWQTGSWRQQDQSWQQSRHSNWSDRRGQHDRASWPSGRQDWNHSNWHN